MRIRSLVLIQFFNLQPKIAVDSSAGYAFA